MSNGGFERWTLKSPLLHRIYDLVRGPDGVRKKAEVDEGRRIAVLP
jgi:hypothetical protein